MRKNGEFQKDECKYIMLKAELKVLSNTDILANPQRCKETLRKRNIYRLNPANNNWIWAY